MAIAEPLTIGQLGAVARGAPPPALAGGALAPHARPPEGGARARARAAVESAVARGDAVYGVTTGFGDLAHVRIAPEDAERLQLNLLRSHAVGTGEPLDAEVVRGMLLLLTASLARGHSGVRLSL